MLTTKQVQTAVETTEDEGTFSAIASAYTLDRQNERVVPGAFRESIRRWLDSGKSVPLAWDHGRAAAEIIGSIDPSSMKETAAGLYVEGALDIEDSELAREAWRSVKANRIGLSFGYVIDDERTGADGVKELTELDLYEVTLTSTPANPDARVLGAKSAPPVRFLTFEIK